MCVAETALSSQTVLPLPPPQRGGRDVLKKVVDLHQTCKWKAGGWTEGWRKKTREAMAQQARWPQKNSSSNILQILMCDTLTEF